MGGTDGIAHDLGDVPVTHSGIPEASAGHTNVIIANADLRDSGVLEVPPGDAEGTGPYAAQVLFGSAVPVAHLPEAVDLHDVLQGLAVREAGIVALGVADWKGGRDQHRVSLPQSD